MTDTYWPFQSDCVSVQLKAVKFDKAELSVSTSIQLFSIPHETKPQYFRSYVFL